MKTTLTAAIAKMRANRRQPQPVRLDWWERAAISMPSGKGLSICVGLWLVASFRKSPTVQVTRRTMMRVGVSRYAFGDGLRCLEGAGLIKVARLPGRSPQVTLVEPGTAIPLRLDGTVAA